VSETVQETINETCCDILLDTKVLDALDKMIRDGEPEFLDARNLKKLEQMRKDAKTPLFNGSSMTKLDANLSLLEMKSRNGLLDKGFDDLLTTFEEQDASLAKWVAREHISGEANDLSIGARSTKDSCMLQ
jgi:hypothetical protein